MFRISRKGDYGLLLLTSLAKIGVGNVVPLRKLAHTLRMPFKFVSQIAPLLVEAEILGSKEGVGGGYFLARDPRSIGIGEVLELLEGPVAPVACMREGCVCEPGVFISAVDEGVYGCGSHRKSLIERDFAAMI